VLPPNGVWVMEATLKRHAVPVQQTIIANTQTGVFHHNVSYFDWLPCGVLITEASRRNRD